MKEFLLETQELLQRLQESNPPKRQNWAERQTLLTESWEEQWSTIFKELLEATYAVPENIMCGRCLDKAAVVRCDMRCDTCALNVTSKFMKAGHFMTGMP